MLRGATQPSTSEQAKDSYLRISSTERKRLLHSLRFGFPGSRWTCSTQVPWLACESKVNISRETVRRYLHHSEVVWRRRRPFLRPNAPDYEAKVLKIDRLVNSLPDNEIARYHDEAEDCTNPKIGSR